MLAVGSETRKEVFVFAAAQIGDRFAVRLHDLEIVVVDPNAAFKASMILVDLLRRNVEDVCLQLVLALLSDVENVVVGNLIGREHEGHDVLQVIGIFVSHRDARQRRGWCVSHCNRPLPMTVEIYVPVLPVLTIDTGAIQSLNNVRLAIGVVSPRGLKFLLLGREPANDLVH